MRRGLLLRARLRDVFAAAGPEVQHFDALLRPLAGAPPEDDRRGERDEAGTGEDDLLQIEEEVEPARDDAERDEDEALDLEEDDEEDQGERRRAEALLLPIGER